MPQPNLNQGPAKQCDIAVVLEALFWPTPYRRRAAKLLGLTPQMVSMMTTGRRRVTPRLWQVLERIAEFRPHDLRREGERAAERLRTEYRKRANMAEAARLMIRTALEEKRRRERRPIQALVAPRYRERPL
jgi:DNA-binding transcriptional regulator YdaS (Cro superfamily)